MAGGLWLVLIIIGTFGFVLGLILNHFLPMLLRLGPVPRGSFGWPILGETLPFLKPHPSNSLGAFLKDHCSRYVSKLIRILFCLKTHELLHICFFRYGKVFKSHLFLSPTVVSCDEELNYFILQNEGKLFECSYPKPIHGILGKASMLVAVGDAHKRLRSVALSLTTITKSNPDFLNHIDTTAIGLLHSWKDKSQVIFCQEARKVSLYHLIYLIGPTFN